MGRLSEQMEIGQPCLMKRTPSTSLAGGVELHLVLWTERSLQILMLNLTSIQLG